MLTDKFCSLQYDVRKCISRGRPRHKCECDCVREGEGEEGKLDTASWFRLPASRVVCFLEWRGRRERYGRYGGNYGRGKSVLLSTFSSKSSLLRQAEPKGVFVSNSWSEWDDGRSVER